MSNSFPDGGQLIRPFSATCGVVICTKGSCLSSSWCRGLLCVRDVFCVLVWVLVFVVWVLVGVCVCVVVRVSRSKNPECAFKTSPCAPSKRLRVYRHHVHMYKTCGHVAAEEVRGGKEGRGRERRVIASSAHQNGPRRVTT